MSGEDSPAVESLRDVAGRALLRAEAAERRLAELEAPHRLAAHEDCEFGGCALCEPPCPDCGEVHDEGRPARTDVELPAGPWSVILADPPWSYDDVAPVKGRARRHYETQGDDWIAGLPVAEVAAADAVLLLWATWPKLDVALEVMRAWGFALKTGLPWVKTHSGFRPAVGTGWWVRGCSEPLLIGVRGEAARPPYPPLGLLEELAGPAPVQATLEDLLLVAPRREHSEKPSEAHWLAERLGKGLEGSDRRLELFARRRVDGWACWGAEAPKETA